MNTPQRMLCVDDEENVLRSLKRLFMDEEYEILTAASGTDGLSILQSTDPVQVVLSDYRMPGMNGVEFLREVRCLSPATVRIVLSGYADSAAVVSAINEGQIYKFIPKPWNDDELRLTIADAFDLSELKEQNVRLSQDLSKRNDELLSLNTILKVQITDKIGDLEARNKKLQQSNITLFLLPDAVVSLSKDGWFISYYNEKARQFFGWKASDQPPLKRADFFDNWTNSVIDRIITNGSGTDTVTINSRHIVMRGERIRHLNNEESFVFTLHEKEDAAASQ
jgi:two-component system NtrC family sensor kinase